jgi:hypothetical protein
MFPRGSFTLLAAVFCWIPPVTAQGPGVVPRVGQSVSVPIPHSKVKVMGRLTHITPDSMVIETKGGSVTLGSLLLDGGRVVTGSKSAVGQGAVIGALLGGLIATGIGAAVVPESSGDLKVAAYGVGGFFGGALMGAIAGSMVSVPKWSGARAPGPSMTPFDVNLVRGDMVRVGPVLGPARVGIAARLAW